jgi:hypothetical protein
MLMCDSPSPYYLSLPISLAQDITFTGIFVYYSYFGIQIQPSYRVYFLEKSSCHTPPANHAKHTGTTKGSGHPGQGGRVGSKIRRSLDEG